MLKEKQFIIILNFNFFIKETDNMTILNKANHVLNNLKMQWSLSKIINASCFWICKISENVEFHKKKKKMFDGAFLL